jgi:hypothetical protein
MDEKKGADKTVKNWKVTFNGEVGQRGKFENPDKKGERVSLDAGKSISFGSKPEAPGKLFCVEKIGDTPTEKKSKKKKKKPAFSGGVNNAVIDGENPVVTADVEPEVVDEKDEDSGPDEIK